MAPLFPIIPATAADQQAISQLIRKVGINPFGLKWKNFLVIKDEAGQIIACGQLKPHNDGSIELASIAVEETYRKQGIAKRIIEALIDKQKKPLFLMCEVELAGFYEQFGFKQETLGSDLPPYFRRIFRVASLFQKLTRTSQKLAVMSIRTIALAKNT